jgi:hypothetical protein
MDRIGVQDAACLACRKACIHKVEVRLSEGAFGSGRGKIRAEHERVRVDVADRLQGSRDVEVAPREASRFDADTVLHQAQQAWKAARCHPKVIDADSGEPFERARKLWRVGQVDV